MIVSHGHAPCTPLLAIVAKKTTHPNPRSSLFALHEDRGGTVAPGEAGSDGREKDEPSRARLSTIGVRVYAKRASSFVSWLVKPSFCILVTSSLCIASSVTTMRTRSPAEEKSTTMLLS